MSQPLRRRPLLRWSAKQRRAMKIYAILLSAAVGYSIVVAVVLAGDATHSEPPGSRLLWAELYIALGMGILASWLLDAREDPSGSVVSANWFGVLTWIVAVLVLGVMAIAGGLAYLMTSLALHLL